ncbi:MAG: rRNA pseudouridine synthase [Rickettsiales bacterium]|jgi:23S rRNA pseudouridine2605 synthase|nr:rRNA pseudouridine synthase [Rickettsiales bacterium]
MLRIAKFLSDNGVASRRGAEALIAQGRVSVNGETIKTPATFVSGKDDVAVDNISVKPNRDRTAAPEIHLFHKPTGCICSTKDPEGRRTIYDVLGEKYKRLKYIGRLDYNTSGLLILTTSGALARELTLPSSGLARTYIAKVGGTMTMDDAMLNRVLAPIKRGIKIDGIIYRPMKIDRIDASTLKITITEGKKNEIRLTFAHVNLPIRKLHRISYGPYELGDLRAGEIRKVKTAPSRRSRE